MAERLRNPTRRLTTPGVTRTDPATRTAARCTGSPKRRTALLSMIFPRSITLSIFLTHIADCREKKYCAYLLMSRNSHSLATLEVEILEEAMEILGRIDAVFDAALTIPPGVATS